MFLVPQMKVPQMEVTQIFPVPQIQAPQMEVTQVFPVPQMQVPRIFAVPHSSKVN